MSAAMSAAALDELIAFRIGDQEFCVDIMAVREIRGWTPAIRLPQTEPYVRGVMNLRGTVLPIVDLGARLGLPASEPTERHVIIVTRVADRLVGLLVDAVSEILTVARDALKPTPDVTCDLARTFVRGLLAVEGRMLSLVALDRVLPASDVQPA